MTRCAPQAEALLDSILSRATNWARLSVITAIIPFVPEQ